MIVIAKGVGRLANRLLLFAHFVGAAAEHGLTVVNPAFGIYAHYFPSTARDLLCRFPAGRRVPAVPGSRPVLHRVSTVAAEALYRLQAHGKDVGLIRLSRDQHLDLNSDAFLEVVRRHRVVFVQDWFFRNADNVARHRDTICSYFTPWERYLSRSRAVLEPARRRGRFVVGVHVRQTDYQTFKDGRFYFSHAQYRTVMEQAEATFPRDNVSFLVCSDAPVPPDAFAGLDVYYGDGEQLVDLYTLAACDRLIGPPSTYNRWASYYGDVPLHQLDDPKETPVPASFRVDSGLQWSREIWTEQVARSLSTLP